MRFDQAVLAARRDVAEESCIEELARAALAEGREDLALPLVREAAERGRSARLWQWAGLLQRALDEHERAIESFKSAAALAPSDPGIAHGRARVALEAGVPCLDLFDAAIALAPRNGSVLLGYVAGLAAEGRGQEAESALGLALDRSPFWVQGHIQFAQLRATLGKRQLATNSVEQALAKHPRREELWTTLFAILLTAEDFAGLDVAVDRARAYFRSEADLLSYEAIAAAEQADVERADSLFDAMPPQLRQSVEVWRIRHLLRTDRVATAIEAIDRELQNPGAAFIWPYAALAWRLAGDRRWEWLEGDIDQITSVIDLGSELSDLGRLEQVLRSLHVAKGQYLDQSVRGGSQTDGPLFCRIDPQIRAVRASVVGAVRRHIEALPALDPRHPLLGQTRNRPVRFSGSWSVLLRGGGRHINHVHPQGWISSAFYVHLPETSVGDAQHAGWLTLGEPQAELGLDLAPVRYIEPKVGRLALFPSWMWHGTIPFERGERMTIAFDVRLPN